MKKTLLYLLAIAMLALMAATGWLYWQYTSVHALAKPVQVMIPSGASSIKIARLLQQQGVITSPTAFRWLVKYKAVANRLRSGLYAFEQPADMAQIIDRLRRGDVMSFQVTVPEGLRTDEVLSLLARRTATPLKDWQMALKTVLPTEDEGRLLPETYQYNKPIQMVRILKSMLKAQNHIMRELSSDADEQQRLRIMASIIERETRIDNERALVASVIRNRLHKRMPLQMDPTVIYGIWKTTGSFSGNIRKKDLSTDTPWNTYTNRGLPPSPIGNPGAASLRAAAAPADSPFLFFVADGSGGHQFATTLAEHNANVRRWIKIERSHQRGQK